MTIPASPISVEGPHVVLEGETVKWTGTMKDEDGAVVPSAQILTFLLDLALLDGTIINSRDDQNIKNANDVTVHATSGLVTWRLTTADLALQDEAKAIEVHRATMRYTYNDGVAVRTGVHRVDFAVQQVTAL